MELKRLGESMDTMLEHLTCLHFVLPQGYVENLKINCMLYIYIYIRYKVSAGTEGLRLLWHCFKRLSPEPDFANPVDLRILK